MGSRGKSTHEDVHGVRVVLWRASGFVGSGQGVGGGSAAGAIEALWNTLGWVILGQVPGYPALYCDHFFSFGLLLLVLQVWWFECCIYEFLIGSGSNRMSGEGLKVNQLLLQTLSVLRLVLLLRLPSEGLCPCCCLCCRFGELKRFIHELLVGSGSNGVSGEGLRLDLLLLQMLSVLLLVFLIRLIRQFLSLAAACVAGLVSLSASSTSSSLAPAATV